MTVNVENAGKVALEWRRVQDAFARPFNPAAVKWKPSMVKNNRALALAYVDARLVMDRLDRVVHIDGWRDEYTLLPDGSVECRLSIRVGDQWVTKADVGSQSEQPDGGDRMKAAYSDALKRAAVKFGIGRYLYRLPQQWVDYDPVARRIAKAPRLPDFAIPVGPDPTEEPDADEPPEPKADTPKPAPAAQAPTQPAGADNHPLRARYAMRLGQCKSRDEYLGICAEVAADVKAGKLTEADRLALAPVAKETSGRFPEASRA